MKTDRKAIIQQDWWSKTFAGGVLGLSLSMAIGSLVVILGKPYIVQDLLVQMGMWSIAWTWLPIMFTSYFIKNGKLALLILGAANVFAYLLLFWLRG